MADETQQPQESAVARAMREMAEKTTAQQKAALAAKNGQTGANDEDPAIGKGPAPAPEPSVTKPDREHKDESIFRIHAPTLNFFMPNGDRISFVKQWLVTKDKEVKKYLKDNYDRLLDHSQTEEGPLETKK